MKHAYHLVHLGRPLCCTMDHQAGRDRCDAAGVTSCSQATLKDARKAMAALNRLPGYAGSTRVVKGHCPMLAEVC